MNKKINSLIRVFKNPLLLIQHIGSTGILNWVPDRIYLKIIFFARLKIPLNLEKPTTFNEKLQWLKINDRKPEYTTYVDKYEVRKFIADTIGEQYLIPMLALYNTVDDIDFDLLPAQFVLKCTHGSSSNIICFDKTKLNVRETKRKLKKWLKKNWYNFGREWPYKDITPRILCEQFLSEINNTPNDYKVLCFSGKAMIIELHSDRFGNHTQDFYDMQWNKLDISQDVPNSEILHEKPKIFDEMIELSEILASNTYHVRIDWYIVDNKLFFGEITFFDGSGFTAFEKKESDLYLGNLIDLKIKK
ncbi:hypothetical protein SDC9_107949 [bioreactor metagenome]|jgi:hypothetical protein|uniref:Glycosyl transferase n=1 Tax=bioreactor metagenome TaxID=1076179 RepID=A0A645B6N6_9ZZZZ|nr:ATP-grasp fold amidoligase family protein [Paludibacter sp.]